MSQFISMTMPASFAGELTRGSFDNTTEVKPNDTASPVSAFGVLVKFNATKNAVTPVTANTDAVLGFAVRVYHQAGNDVNVVTVLKRGYIAVEAPSGETIVPNSPVYIATNGALTSVSSGTTALSGAVFNGPVSSDGLVEVAYNI